ncbi:FadR/GntR family transcriptional regulator [Pseudonocardia sp. GCM10023141]|uniref:FadR/GntR family transcriptional regulator n=1 Tax=Pseudonocardia sp. GCM10023141 TaxID=3252653 RepID=UPI003610FA8E
MAENGGDRPDAHLSLTPVVRGGLTDRVIDQLRQRIAGGIWPVGGRLPVEAELARELAVGRSTIREAVRVLAHSGLLEVRQGDGTYVRSRREIDAALRRRVHSADVLDAFRVRRALEIEIARSAATLPAAADVARLQELAAAHEEVAESVARRRSDAALHEHILDMTGNALLIDLYRGLFDPLDIPARTTFDATELARDDVETAQLVRAIVEQDPAAAVAAVERRMDTALRVLTLLLQAAPI